MQSSSADRKLVHAGVDGPAGHSELEVKRQFERLQLVVDGNAVVITELAWIWIDEGSEVAPALLHARTEVVQDGPDGQPAEEVGAELGTEVDSKARGRRVPDALLDKLGRDTHRETVGDGAAVRNGQRDVAGVEGLAGAFLAVFGAHQHVRHAQHRHRQTKCAEGSQVKPDAEVIEVDVGQPLAVGDYRLAAGHPGQAGGVPVQRRGIVGRRYEGTAHGHCARPDPDL